MLADLALPDSRVVPLFTELTSSSDVWQRKDRAVRLQESKNRRAESWIDRDAESAVSCLTLQSAFILSDHDARPTILKSRRGTIGLGALMPHDKHWNLGPILGLVPHLFHGEFIRLEAFHIRRAVYAPRRLQGRRGIEIIHIKASNDTGIGKACHGNKDVREGTATIHLGSSNKGWCYACKLLSGQGIEVYFVNDLMFVERQGILELGHSEPTDIALVYNSKFVCANGHYVAQRCILFFGDQVYLCALGISEVNRDDFIFWGIPVGAKVQPCSIVCDAAGKALAMAGNDED